MILGRMHWPVGPLGPLGNDVGAETCGRDQRVVHQSDWSARKCPGDTPSFLIRAISVVLFKPSFAAAPFRPPTTPLVRRSVAVMWARSASARVVTPSVCSC